MTSGCIQHGVHQRERGWATTSRASSLDDDNAGGVTSDKLFDFVRACVHAACEIRTISERSQAGTNHAQAAVEQHPSDMPRRYGHREEWKSNERRGIRGTIDKVLRELLDGRRTPFLRFVV